MKNADHRNPFDGTPGPGDVFREFTYVNTARGHIAELDPAATAPGALALRPQISVRTPVTLDLGDLAGATRAEIAVEYWGGHPGTSYQGVRVNGRAWFPLPCPLNTPTEPEVYYRTVLGAAIPIPIELLRPGENSFNFTAGPQIRYDFGWGFYWVYAFTVRIYFSAVQALGSTRVRVLRAAGPEQVTLALQRAPADLTQVDFVGHYTDFDWRGVGHWRQWQYQTRRGAWHHHIGSATQPPYRITWDTAWVPDPTGPVQIMARLRDATGLYIMTPLTHLTVLPRVGRRVALYPATDVPEIFGARVGQRKTCQIPVADDLSHARAAQLVLSTWSAAHADAIGLNGVTLTPRVGLVHDYSFDAIPVPVELLQQGDNEFFIYATTEHHAAEVNWPGPALKIIYEDKP